MLQIRDDLRDLGERPRRRQTRADRRADVVHEQPVEGLAEELVDISVVLRDAVHEEVEALDEVADLFSFWVGVLGVWMWLF